MSTIDDTFAKHGVLATGAKPKPKPAKTTEPLWKSLRGGDQIEITSHTGSDNGYWIEKSAGIFTVDQVDRADHAVGDLRVLLPGGWVKPERIVRVVSRVGDTKPAVETPAPAQSAIPVYKQAKVGDKIAVLSGRDHPSGTFTVTSINDFSDYKRLAVNYEGRNNAIWWVKNELVMEIISAAGAEPVRGNFLIHVDVPTIMSNRAKSEHGPVVVARHLSKATEAKVFRELAWDGPSRFVHHHFARIEGTDIQNWVETDAPLTCWRDGEGLLTMDPLTGAPGSAKAMHKQILGGFIIHIAAPVLMANRKNGTNLPVIAVRKAFTNWATDVVFARRVEWNGPSRMVHRPSTPIPGTEGRGVAFIETDADVTVYFDDRDPEVLRMPQLKAAA